VPGVGWCLGWGWPVRGALGLSGCFSQKLVFWPVPVLALVAGGLNRSGARVLPGRACCFPFSPANAPAHARTPAVLKVQGTVIGTVKAAWLCRPPRHGCASPPARLCLPYRCPHGGRDKPQQGGLSGSGALFGAVHMQAVCSPKRGSGRGNNPSPSRPRLSRSCPTGHLLKTEVVITCAKLRRCSGGAAKRFPPKRGKTPGAGGGVAKRDAIGVVALSMTSRSWMSSWFPGAGGVSVKATPSQGNGGAQALNSIEP